MNDFISRKTEVPPAQPQPSTEAYVAGFALSILLTLAAYTLVAGRFIGDAGRLMAIVLLLALVQFGVQLKFFLHLGIKASKRWDLVVFVSTLGIVFILVAGSLWIMGHLNYHMMPGQMEKQIIHDEGIKNKEP